MEKNKKPRNLKDLLKENVVDQKLEGEVIEEVKLSLIKPNPYQPRRNFNPEKIKELADSIKMHGVFQPIILKQVKDGYLIVSGERRFRASLSVGLETIPAIIRPYEANKLAEIALLENLQREDLTPIEEAQGYQAMMQRFNLTHLELSKQVGKSRSHITNLLGLLKLPEEVSNMLSEKKISMSHARALSKLSSHDNMIKLAQDIINKDLSVRQIENILKKQNASKGTVSKRTYFLDDEVVEIIEHKFKVKLKTTNKSLIFESYNQEDLDKIIDILVK